MADTSSSKSEKKQPLIGEEEAASTPDGQPRWKRVILMGPDGWGWAVGSKLFQILTAVCAGAGATRVICTWLPRVYSQLLHPAAMVNRCSSGCIQWSQWPATASGYGQQVQPAGTVSV